MSTMDNNVLHHPIKFSIKTNDLEKLKKKPDKSFFKIEVTETDVKETEIKNDLYKPGIFNDLILKPEEGLKGRPLICDNVISDKMKKSIKRTHQSELESETIKQRKIEDKDQVIIEPETSSALVIRGLPRSVVPPVVTKEQSILQIFSKCKDVITDKLEEKMNLIDRICQNSSISQISCEDGHRKNNAKKQTMTEINSISKNINTEKIGLMKCKNESKNLELKVDKVQNDLFSDKSYIKQGRTDFKKHQKKALEETSENKIIKPVDSIRNAEKSDSNILKEKVSESHRSPHRRSSHDKSRKSSKKYSPSKSDRHNKSHRSDNIHKSETKSKDRRRRSHSKSPRKSKGNDNRHEESKSQRSIPSLQMGPLSLREEFPLENDKNVVDPEKELEESFNCKVTAIPVKDKRNIAERLQKLFNKSKLAEEKEDTLIFLANKEEKIVHSDSIKSNFQPENAAVPINVSENILLSSDKISFTIPTLNKASIPQLAFSESKIIPKSKPVGMEHLKGSQIETKIKKSPSNIKLLSVNKGIVENRLSLKSPKCLSLNDINDKNICTEKETLDSKIKKHSVHENLPLVPKIENISETFQDHKCGSISPVLLDKNARHSTEIESHIFDIKLSEIVPPNETKTEYSKKNETHADTTHSKDLEDQLKTNWSQESHLKTIEQENIKVDSKIDESPLIREKVSFMISPRKVVPKIPQFLPIKLQTKSSLIVEMAKKNESEVWLETVPLLPSVEEVSGNGEIHATEDSKIEIPITITNIPQIVAGDISPNSLSKVSSPINNPNHDLNLYFINHDVRKSEENCRKMHIEKTVIMEPLSKTCSISFRFKTNIKEETNIFTEIANKTLINSPSTEIPERKTNHSIVENSSIELIESKPMTEQKSSINLSNILDNYLVQSKSVEKLNPDLHLTTKEFGDPSEKNLNFVCCTESNDDLNKCVKAGEDSKIMEDENNGKCDEKCLTVLTKDSVNVIDNSVDLSDRSKYDKVEEPSKYHEIADKTLQPTTVIKMKNENLEHPKLLINSIEPIAKEIKTTESGKSKSNDIENYLITLDDTSITKIDKKIDKKNNDNETKPHLVRPLANECHENKKAGYRTKPAENDWRNSKHIEKNEEKMILLKSKEVHESKDFTGKIFGSRKAREERSKRCYRTGTRNESRSTSKTRVQSNSSWDTFDSDRKNRRAKEHSNSRRRYDHRAVRHSSKDHKRFIRSRSKYSKKHRSNSSHNRMSNSSNRKFRSRHDNSFEKRQYDRQKSKDRMKIDRKRSRSRCKWSEKKKLLKCRSISRKRSKNKHHYRSDSSKDSVASKNKCNDHRRKPREPNSCDRTSKDTYHSKGLVNSKEKSKSYKRSHKSKSKDKIDKKAQSKLLDHSKMVDEIICEKSVTSIVEQSEPNLKDDQLGILHKNSETNLDLKTLSCEVASKSNELKVESEISEKGKTPIEQSQTSTEIKPAGNHDNELKITIKERSCAEKCMLNFLNRHLTKTTNVKSSAPEIANTYQTIPVCNQLTNQNYYLHSPSANIAMNNNQASNINYFMNSQQLPQNQSHIFPPLSSPSLMHNQYPQGAYQSTPYPNYYLPQTSANLYQSQSYENRTQTFPTYTYTKPFQDEVVKAQLTSCDSAIKECSVTLPPPPPPSSPKLKSPIIVTDDTFNRTRNSSTSSLSNSLMDMEIASASQKSMASNVGLKMDDNMSNNDDDLSSCDEFQYDDIEPQDPFQKYSDAPRPEYEHIIKTEVHVSAVGKRFEYAYLKSTPCNCVPPNPDEIRLGKAACDENCFNRQIKVECNRNCPVYELCTNRRFQEQIYGPIEPFYCGPDKGWGIRSLSNIMPGTFVIEYVGELIDFDEFSKRVNGNGTFNPHFLMVIQKDMYLDAGNKGNWARFVNHSCDPNTVIERWVVNGKTRIGFFSKKRILKDEEITIDYQFQQYGSVEQKCYCASVNCTGIMGKVNEKLQEQIKMSAVRHRNELIQRIISRKSLKEISHVSDMITVIKENTLERDTFVSFLEVLLRTSSHVCVRTFIECGGLNVITSYLDTVLWKDWGLKLLYLQCLDHFKLRKRTLINSGHTSATVVDYWSENPRYETKHVVEDSLNIDSFNDDSESVNDSLELIPTDSECPIQFSLPNSDEMVDDVEKQVQNLALKIKDYFGQEKEKFFIPKIKTNPIEFSTEFSTNDSESKSISIASSVQGDFVQMKTKRIKNKCNEAIQRLPKDEFRRLFTERHDRLIAERNQCVANLEANDNGRNIEEFHALKQLLSNVINEEISNLKHNEQLSTMPLEFQNNDIDKILSSLNIVDKESLLPLLTPQQDDTGKSGSLSNYSKSSDDTPRRDQDTPLSSIDQLPPNWRFCRCDNGRVYFYNIISKKTQWETPIYPWDAGDDDPSSFDYNDASKYPITSEDVKYMLQRYKINYKEAKLQERQIRRLERTLQRKLNQSVGEKNKIQFSHEVFKAVKVQMKPYFSSSCKLGRVKTKQDLKFLCEKFADTIIGKEVKSVASLEDLELNSDVSSKINSYIRKYMSNQGRFFKRSNKPPKLKSDRTGNSKADSLGSSTPNFSL